MEIQVLKKASTIMLLHLFIAYNSLKEEVVILNSIMSLIHVVDYIEEHIKEEMKVDKLAEEADLSKFYFHRLFFGIVGRTAMEYIKS